MLVSPSLVSRVPTSSSMIRARSSWVGGCSHFLLSLCTTVVKMSHSKKLIQHLTHLCRLLCASLTEWMGLCTVCLRPLKVSCVLIWLQHSFTARQRFVYLQSLETSRHFLIRFPKLLNFSKRNKCRRQIEALFSFEVSPHAPTAQLPTGICMQKGIYVRTGNVCFVAAGGNSKKKNGENLC